MLLGFGFVVWRGVGSGEGTADATGVALAAYDAVGNARKASGGKDANCVGVLLDALEQADNISNSESESVRHTGHFKTSPS